MHSVLENSSGADGVTAGNPEDGQGSTVPNGESNFIAESMTPIG